jgi:beta-galactosidase GanA
MAPSSNIPHLQQFGNTKQLIVNGEPYLMLGGELQNSSLSSAEYMNEVWPKMVATNVNTLLGSVSWEMIEPEEGKFEFGELDKVIQGAREHGLHLILLWFGSFKNGMSLAS